jgi:predicted TIM-barrel fold metal-dependent hydrolase
MPEVRALFETGALAVDTAATRYLYDPRIVEAALTLGVGGAVLWGSDFPLRSQLEDRRELEAATADPEARAAILGGNAARLLSL